MAQKFFDSLEYKSNLENINTEKAAFLKEFELQYGYGGKIDQIREEEYPQLNGAIFLDHSATTTYAKSSLTSFTTDLTNNLYGNPHANSPSSQRCNQRLDQIRDRVLRHFNTNPDYYQVIFTQNATAAIKLVGEIFPWTSGQSSYKYLRESHNSIIGLRRFAEEINAQSIQAITEDDFFSVFDSDSVRQTKYLPRDNHNNITYNLFAYPAQCNFSGIRFPLTWTCEIKKFNNKNNDSKTLVLLDAAAYISSSLLSLSEVDTSPDFITISFYKMFGYPTGLGALIVKSELEPILRKRYFGGGTLDSIAYDRPWQKFRKSLHERYEDGTINFLDIIALDHAFDASERLFNNFNFIKSHVTSLMIYLSRNMKSLQHYNGRSVCVVYSNNDFSDNTFQGPVFSFNVKRADGSWVGYLELERLASVNGIHIRSGILCNPGSVARWIKLYPENIIDSFASGKTCHDEQDMWDGKPAGAVRISVVPIKSCHGFNISPFTSWPITSQGLLYDREWMLIDAGKGKALSQKILPRMTLIRPVILRDKGLLLVSAPDRDPLYINLDPEGVELSTYSSQVCGDKIQAYIYTSPEISEWFSSFLGLSCRLARHASMTNDCLMQRRFIKPHLDASENAPLSLSNESPFLMISHSSVDHVNKKIKEEGNREVKPDCFRGNFLINGATEFDEDQWKMVRFGGQVFKIIGPCRRCRMVCINHENAEVTKEPYSTLARCRRFKGKIYFGHHMVHVPDLSKIPYVIESGSSVQIEYIN
ncbi:14071_t:CDS:2 [Funneliformis mosseae]|uniref:Molybdenum cofactor sulfurase n=1 Tax=Funneliformis mosseae TaxID=27381 RepID=A0A9N9AJ88_FUNMO|nr:14071_t:CDS:2 [Funneliformis mosseae]